MQVQGCKAESSDIHPRALSQIRIPNAVILNFASRKLVNSGHILVDENELFTSLLKSGLELQIIK